MGPPLNACAWRRAEICVSFLELGGIGVDLFPHTHSFLLRVFLYVDPYPSFPREESTCIRIGNLNRSIAAYLEYLPKPDALRSADSTIVT